MKQLDLIGPWPLRLSHAVALAQEWQAPIGSQVVSEEDLVLIFDLTVPEDDSLTVTDDTGDVRFGPGAHVVFRLGIHGTGRAPSAAVQERFDNVGR